MMHFDYEIKYVPGIKNVVADELSRSCIDDTIRVPIIQFAEPCMKVESLESEYQADRFLQELKQRIISGNWNNVSAREKPFKQLALQMSIDDKGHIRLGSKLLPPQTLQKEIISVAHQSHNGIQSTLRLIQREFF